MKKLIFFAIILLTTLQGFSQYRPYGAYMFQKVKYNNGEYLSEQHYSFFTFDTLYNKVTIYTPTFQWECTIVSDELTINSVNLKKNVLELDSGHVLEVYTKISPITSSTIIYKIKLHPPVGSGVITYIYSFESAQTGSKT